MTEKVTQYSIGPFEFDGLDTVTLQPGVYVVTEPIRLGKDTHITGIEYTAPFRRFTPEQLRRWAAQWAAGPIKVPEPPAGDDGLTLAETFKLLADQIEALNAKLDTAQRNSYPVIGVDIPRDAY